MPGQGTERGLLNCSDDLLVKSKMCDRGLTLSKQTFWDRMGLRLPAGFFICEYVAGVVFASESLL